MDKLEPNRERIAESMARSLMPVTALDPRIGYDEAVQVGKKTLAEDLIPKDAAARPGHAAPEDFDRRVRPADMVEPGATLDGGGG